jgi:hypothetical protein
MASFSDNSVTYDNLLVGGSDFTTERGTLISGQTVVRGEALGKITSGGKLTSWGSGGSDDGHRTFYALAAEDGDASAGDVAISYYKTGVFAIDQVTISGEASADDVSDIDATARDIGIILIQNTTVQN